MSENFDRLNRILYGLKKSGRQWTGLLVETVVEYGMAQCTTDPCVFRTFVDDKVEMTVHRYDIVIEGSDEACREFRSAYNIKFPTKNLEE